jgi:hemolysin activation/secretion protein
LGGSNSLRSFDSYRVRGERLVQLTVESQWRIFKHLDIVPFVDVGRVGGSTIDAGTQGWLVSAGAGARARFKSAVVGRLDVSTGRDGLRVAYAFNAPF